MTLIGLENGKYFLCWKKKEGFEKKPELKKKFTFMQNFMTYLSTAPVVGLAWIGFTAGFIIEINRFFPDPLIFSF